MRHAGARTLRFIELYLPVFAMVVVLFAAGCKTNSSKRDVANSSIILLKGDARFTTDLKSWAPAHVGDELPSGCLVQTASGSRVDIELGQAPDAQRATVVNYPSANQIALRESTVVKIEQQTDDALGKTTEIDLRAGTLACYVSRTKHPSFEVKTITNIVRTSGGTLMVTASGEIQVWKGSAILETSETKLPRQMSVGESYDPTTGEITKMESRGIIACGQRHSTARRAEGFDQLINSFEQRRTAVWAESPSRVH